MRILYFFLLLILVLFASCSVVIKDLTQYSSIRAGKAPIIPALKSIQTTQTKIALYNIEDKTVKNGSSAISNIASSLIREILTQTNVSIIDRSAIAKFSDEAILSASTSGKDLEFAVAQYAIKGQIDNTNSYSLYKNGYYETIPGYTAQSADGSTYYVPVKTIYHPPLCIYTGEVQGRFEVYTLPRLELILNIPLHGKGSKTVTAHNFSRICNDQNVRATSFQIAVKNAITSKDQKKLLNQFAAKGYIRDIRRHRKKNKYIIQVTLGNKNGITQNGTLNVYRQKNQLDHLSGKVKIANIIIAEARISQLVADDHAWLVVKNKDEAKKILIGDVVRVIY